MLNRGKTVNTVIKVLYRRDIKEDNINEIQLNAFYSSLKKTRIWLTLYG